MRNADGIDLHLHTTASDGSDTPSALVQRALSRGLKVISVTDHDTVAGIGEAIAAADGKIRVIPGIEFSCHAYCEGGFDCHILGYGFDVGYGAVAEAIAHGRQRRMMKLEARLAYLKEEFGISVSDEELSELRSYNSVAKPHLARILIKRGLAESVGDAIGRYFSCPKFPDDRIDAHEAISAIRRGGGVAVWAHPLGGEREARIDEMELNRRAEVLARLGLDGLECYYSRYDLDSSGMVLRAADRLGLLVSGGSDYHGENKTVVMGELSSDDVRVGAEDITVLKQL